MTFELQRDNPRVRGAGGGRVRRGGGAVRQHARRGHALHLHERQVQRRAADGRRRHPRHRRRDAAQNVPVVNE